MALDPAVAATRLPIRRRLHTLLTARAGRVSPDGSGGRRVLVACSGGADSLALLAATVFEAASTPLQVIGVTVDHGLQDGSAERAERTVAQMAALGADETVGVRVTVEASGQGPEAAAREARYAVLEEVSERFDRAVVLLGHTLDDQAETVLLGLARGSGARSLAGMRGGFDCFWRPLIGLTRAQTEQACRAQGIEWWTDPHNDDPRFTRSRVRHRVLPVLEEELGPGVAQALARTASQLRDDVDLLDELADDALADARRDPGDVRAGLLLDLVSDQPSAVASRVLRLAALEAGSPGEELGYGHVMALVALATGHELEMSGKQIQLPGHVTAYREGDLLRFRTTAVPG